MTSAATGKPDGLTQFIYHLMCDMLVDQERYIGVDPVGYKCSAPAVFESAEGYLFCEECNHTLTNEPARLTFPRVYGRAAQERSIRKILKV